MPRFKVVKGRSHKGFSGLRGDPRKVATYIARRGLSQDPDACRFPADCGCPDCEPDDAT